MVRSTDSRRARNSDSVMTGGRRRPDSRPSRLRCFFASRRVDPLMARTSSAGLCASLTCTTVSGGSSGDSASPSPATRRRLRRRRRLELLPSPGPSPSPSASASSSSLSLSSAPPSVSSAAAAPPRVLVRVLRRRRRRALTDSSPSSGPGAARGRGVGVVRLGDRAGALRAEQVVIGCAIAHPGPCPAAAPAAGRPRLGGGLRLVVGHAALAAGAPGPVAGRTALGGTRLIAGGTAALAPGAPGPAARPRAGIRLRRTAAVPAVAVPAVGSRPSASRPSVSRSRPAGGARRRRRLEKHLRRLEDRSGHRWRGLGRPVERRRYGSGSRCVASGLVSASGSVGVCLVAVALAVEHSGNLQSGHPNPLLFG